MNLNGEPGKPLSADKQSAYDSLMEDLDKDVRESYLRIRNKAEALNDAEFLTMLLGRGLLAMDSQLEKARKARAGAPAARASRARNQQNVLSGQEALEQIHGGGGGIQQGFVSNKIKGN